LLYFSVVLPEVALSNFSQHPVHLHFPLVSANFSSQELLESKDQLPREHFPLVLVRRPLAFNKGSHSQVHPFLKETSEKDLVLLFEELLTFSGVELFCLALYYCLAEATEADEELCPEFLEII
jgi:hypothetical protein